MNRYANKPEVMLALREGGHIESHDLMHWLVKPSGKSARLRYSLWRILTGRNAPIVQIRKEMRPPSRLPYFIYALRAEAPDKGRASGIVDAQEKPKSRLIASNAAKKRWEGKG